MRPDVIVTYSEALKAARAAGKQIVPPGEIPTYSEAIAIQAAVQTDLGAVAGFKVAARPEGPPILAPISAHRVFDSGVAIPSPNMAGVELEIAFELMQPFSDAPLRDLFRPRLVMELVDTRFSGDALDPMQKMSDMQLNDGLVLGPVLDSWDGSDFGTVQARMTGADRVILDGAAEVPGGSALANLQLCLDHLGDHCGGVQPGQHIITGSLCGLPWFGAGDVVQAEIAGFGEVKAALVPR